MEICLNIITNWNDDNDVFISNVTFIRPFAACVRSRLRPFNPFALLWQLLSILRHSSTFNTGPFRDLVSETFFRNCLVWPRLTSEDESLRMEKSKMEFINVCVICFIFRYCLLIESRFVWRADEMETAVSDSLRDHTKRNVKLIIFFYCNEKYDIDLLSEEAYLVCFSNEPGLISHRALIFLISVLILFINSIYHRKIRRNQKSTSAIN